MNGGFTMEWSYIWKAVLIVLVGTLLLRISGRKTISQMTLAETVIMISIGTLLVQPIAGKSVWTSFMVGVVLVGTLLVLEVVQLKSDRMEKMLTGQAKIVIENGKLNEKNLKKLRLTVDQLEMRLRQKSISRISDVKWATLEPNGQIGFELKEEAQPVTKKDFEEFKQTIVTLLPSNTQLAHIDEILSRVNSHFDYEPKEDLFLEVQNQDHKIPPPKHLQ